jgi:hypothetical protein
MALASAEYKHVVLGLLFLKYISDAFEARRENSGRARSDGTASSALKARALLESRDEYTAERSSGCRPRRAGPPANQATRPDIATLIDDAILACRARQPQSQGQAPARLCPPRHRACQAQGPDRPDRRHRLQGRPRKARDTLGRVYEYFLGKFAGRPRASSAASSSRRAASCAAGRDARALPGPRLRPLLRLRRHVRAVRALRRGPRRADAPTSPSSARSPTPPPGGWPT